MSSTSESDASSVEEESPTPARRRAPANVPENIAESGAFTLSEDPVAVNDAHRHPDVSNADLWSIDQVAAAFPAGAGVRAPIFAPVNWAAAKPVAQAEYSASFARRFMIANKVLPMRHVFVAGGAAAWPLGDPAHRAGDVDFFIYGVDPANTAALWKIVAKLAKRISVEAKKAYQVVSQTLTAGVVTLLAHNVTYHSSAATEKFQIVLRVYPSISACLHAFDIPSAAVAYDGARAYTTTLGAHAHVHRVNTVVPAYRSTTYEARLMKYFDRGYALELPDFDRRLFVAASTVVLPHLRLDVDVAGGAMAAGSLRPPEGAPAPPASDYGSDYEYRWDFDRTLVRSKYINTYQFASGRNRFVVIGYCEEISDYDETAIPFQQYVDRGSPMLSDIISQAQLESTLGLYARSVTPSASGVTIAITPLRRIFGLTEAEISRAVEAVSEARRLNPGRRLNIRSSLARNIRAILDRYAALPGVIPWWIIQDPGRQYTASVDPRMESPAEWYGASAFAHRSTVLVSDADVNAFREARRCWAEAPASEKPKKPVFDGTCAICGDEIHAGDAITIVLDCGHTFHAIFNEDCSGLLPWVTKGNTKCPSCRRDISVAPVVSQEEKIGRRRRVPPAEVLVAW
ncbi:MAG: RING finger domain-containing protein [Gemmatimonadaceae bacterium]|jgi:hypothetical protein